ncbi:hypothetical protein [Salidesulfovibrio onnuriiensis]|uniref:hypothetical protein n=1 Tax=Salidesulfovibrio onnuriiensis TaxID=2583823 RepID=UPI0011C8BC2E|nr:hypothetical protein [Salidesulfovibrio onnuriiensis]
MRLLKYIVFSIVLLGAGLAQAQPVEVFVPFEEGMTSMQLRQKATDAAFAQSVTDTALSLLPAPLSEDRQVLLKQYFLEKAGGYVLGYKEVSSFRAEDGLNLTMDVNVNRQALRTALQSMGIYYTVSEPLPVTFRHQGELDEESLQQVRDLILLTGLKRDLDVQPEFLLQREGEKLWKGRLIFEGRDWVAVKKDIPELWFELWKRYFGRKEMRESASSSTRLRVSGWFTPDGVQDFDRVLQGWVSAVQEVKLAEMEMLPSGVAAIWDVRVVNRQLLKSRLEAFLPGRGLSFVITSKE